MKRLFIVSVLLSSMIFDELCSVENFNQNQGKAQLTPAFGLPPLGVATVNNFNNDQIVLQAGRDAILNKFKELVATCENYLSDRMETFTGSALKENTQEIYLQKCKNYYKEDRLFFDALFEKKNIDPALIKNNQGNNLLQMLWINAASVTLACKDDSSLSEKYQLFIKYYLVPMSKYFIKKNITWNANFR